MQDDHSHERALAQYEELMGLRPTFLDHKSVLVSIDHAIGNVFESRNHDEISKHITKIKELVGFLRKMKELGVGTKGIELPLPNLHVSQANPKYQKVNAKYEKLKDIRLRLALLGIPTVGVETAMAEVLMKHGAALAVQVLEEPTLVKGQSSSTEIKSEPSMGVLCQSVAHDIITSPYTAGTTSTMKRSVPLDDAGDANLEDISKGEVNETKRRKAGPMASLEVRSRNGKECTEAWSVPVNEVATEGLRLVSKESDGSLLLSFNTNTQSIVVVFKEKCLSTKYDSLELMPVDIHTIKRNPLNTKQDLKARLFTRDYENKVHSFDIIFPSAKECETFLGRIQSSCYDKIDSSSPDRYMMKKLFEDGLWSEKKVKIFGRAAKTKYMKIVELE